MKFTEEKLNSFEAPLSASEDQKCKNAIAMVRDALKDYGFSEGTDSIKKAYDDTYAYTISMRNATTGRRVKLLVQGSYANNTNVRTESDVDIAVILESTFFSDYPVGVTNETYNIKKSNDNVWTFKDDVEKVLRRYFVTGVERKNKSIKIHGNSNRVDADTVPSIRNRDYRMDTYRTGHFIEGIYIIADDGTTVVNYPEQHIANGRKKNTDTKLYYKKMVRVIKKIRYLMLESHIKEADKVNSFALESLLWNIPDSLYLNNSNYRHVYIFDQIINYLKINLGSLSIYKEANGIKALCPDSESLINMRNFINKLSEFYEYE